jgi:hypothetical protein
MRTGGDMPQSDRASEPPVLPEPSRDKLRRSKQILDELQRLSPATVDGLVVLLEQLLDAKRRERVVVGHLKKRLGASCKRFGC